MAIALRYAARTDLGLGRYSFNQDSAYAGPHLLAVADGMGGHAGGDIASSVVLARLVALDGESIGGDAMARLGDVLRAANEELRHRVDSEPDLRGMGTTVTALLRYGSRLAVAHIGDSRGYLLRDGVLSQITHDHSFVQSLVDEGRISAEDALHHPQRNIVTRVLTGQEDDEPDLSVREARPGDRYLLCSDGLSDVLTDDTVAEVLVDAVDPGAAAERLIELALRAGAPDNVTCVVADVVDLTTGAAAALPPQVVGAAAEQGVVAPPTSPLQDTASPAAKAAALTRSSKRTATTDDEPAVVPPPSRVRRWSLRLLLTLLVLALLGGGGAAAYAWSQQQYFVGADGGHVAIFRGLPQDVGPLTLSSVYERQQIGLADLPAYPREQVQGKITADNLGDARSKVHQLLQQSRLCQPATASGVPTATPTKAPTKVPTTTPSKAATTVPAKAPRTTPTTAKVAAPTATPTATPSKAPTPTTTPTLPAGCEGR